MRALGFDVKKAEVSKILQEHNKQGAGVMDFDDYFAVSTCTALPGHAGWHAPVAHSTCMFTP